MNFYYLVITFVLAGLSIFSLRRRGEHKKEQGDDEQPARIDCAKSEGLKEMDLTEENLAIWQKKDGTGAFLTRTNWINVFVHSPPLHEAKATEDFASLDDFGRCLAGALNLSHGGYEPVGPPIDLRPEDFGNAAGFSWIRRVGQFPAGFMFMANLAVPFKELTYHIQIGCPDLGEPGRRETLALKQESRERNGFPAEDVVHFDPYDSKYDELLDDFYHPLLQARTYISIISQYFEVAPSVSDRLSLLAVPGTEEMQRFADSLLDWKELEKVTPAYVPPHELAPEQAKRREDMLRQPIPS